jgi:acetyltransferase-like isoleucine patch superfamily enzyme
MISYLLSIFSIKKLTHNCVSMFAYWDKSSSFSKLSEIRRFAKLKNSVIGKYSRINPNCRLSNVSVGNFTAVGRDTSIGLGRHPLNYASTQNIFYKNNNMSNRWVKSIEHPTLPIKIGNDVWIGVESMILDGVTVGDGAVIGARSVVTKDVPPYAIVVGSPAKIIKYRFDKVVIDRLLQVKWWDLTEKEIDDKLSFFRETKISVKIINKYFSIK